MTELLVKSLDGIRFTDGGKIAHLRVGLGTAGQPAELSFPVEGVNEIWAKLGGIVAALRDNGVLPPEEKPPGTQQDVIQVKTWKLGSNTFAGKFTALLVDEGLSTEHLLVFPDLAALMIADAIEQKVMDGMSEEDKKALMTEVEKATGRRPRILMPEARRTRH